MIRGRYIYLLLLLTTAVAKGQNVVTAEDFFNRPLPGASNQAGEGVGPTPTMPWIQQYEFRTETRDLVPDRQEYTFRVEPSTPRLRRAQQHLARTMEDRPDLLNQEFTCEENERRHRHWLRLFGIDRELILLDSIAVILADRQLVLDRQSTALEFNFADLIDNRRDQTDVATRRAELDFERTQLLTSYGMDPAELDFQDFPTPGELTIETGVDLRPIDATEDAFDLALVEQELAVEYAERRRYLNFAQFRYRGPHDSELSDRISVGFGLQLSNRGKDRLKVHELEIEREELSSQMQYERNALEAIRGEYRGYHQDAVAFYARNEALYAAERQELGRLQLVLLRQETPKILLVLNTKKRALRNEIDLLRLRLSLTEDYLDYLEDTDQFCDGLDGRYLRTAPNN